MELEHQFSVPVPVAQAWDVLLDVERIAPCMPGATVDSFDGETIVGKVKVKEGPIQVTYAGTAKFVEKDEAGRRAVIEARAKEARGTGTAAATITAVLTDAGGSSTDVVVTTDLAITGKPAQFGRGVMAEVGNKLTLAYIERGNWAQAAVELERIAANNKDPKVARDALWQAAELYEKYLAAYRAATGVDLANKLDSKVPSVLLARRRARAQHQPLSPSRRRPR